MIEKKFAILWATWAVLALAAEFLWNWYPVWSIALFALALAWFVGIEAWAVMREGKGDTLSEQVWAFLFTDPDPDYTADDHARGASSEIRHARLVLVAGVVVWIGARLYALMGGDEIAVLVGRLALVVGICAWLALHFYFRGRWG